MADRNERIHLRVVAGDSVHELVTRPGEYRSLMALIYDRVWVDGFGDCRGMGRCGTCRVLVDGDPGELTGMDRNETATLSKAGQSAGTARLACQLVIDQRLNGRTITVMLDQ
ncbi:MAG TPA: 2Fe-2S iron-sulfur cluster-binding protein [Puia sp.]|uniref:2Fe-2S iron-sulfur cluster-binding protein n=1 Tax=Puia sp. TaxID=2045100 RepID=UPI002BAB749A|nr:2Fe-2S iron-sulfur cluster-binding protein [Puia sp.]HVU94073.1 2Fe-2S iron-sulfur cluster-binding protein [Puia sp.]